jgi:FkbM family methyltransferase
VSRYPRVKAEGATHVRELNSLEKKIILATEGFMTKFSESTLRNKLCKENALAVADYIIAMKREINPRLNYIRYTIQFLFELSKIIGIEKHFVDMTRNNILFYLDKCRKPEDEDPLHKWIGSYNLKRIILIRFFKWLYYPNIASPKRRNELSLEENKPECILGIPQLKRKEISCYKPTDMWTRDRYLKSTRIYVADFLPERPYAIHGVKAIPRKGSSDFSMFFESREQDVKSNLLMNENETFADVGANIGSYSLRIANNYKDKGVKVIAIEAHPENSKALDKNVRCNDFTNVKIINKAVCDHKGIVTLYERSHDGTRAGSDMHSLFNTFLHPSNSVLPHGKTLQLECDTLDNILAGYKVDVMKIDIEGVEVLALKGATNTLRNLRKIIVEIHGDNFDKVSEILKSSNFNLEVSKGAMQHIIGSK